jgi:transcriptional regulator with XRE-family HTH domain
MSFSDRLSALRKERGLTQKGLATACDMHATQIQRYESGETQPTLDAIRRLALALSVSSDALIFDEDERGPDEHFRLQFEALTKFTPEEKKVARAVIDGLILKHTATRFSEAQ